MPEVTLPIAIWPGARWAYAHSAYLFSDRGAYEVVQIAIPDDCDDVHAYLEEEVYERWLQRTRAADLIELDQEEAV